MKKTNRIIALVCAVSLFTSTAQAGWQEAVVEGGWQVVVGFGRGIGELIARDVYPWLKEHKKEATACAIVLVAGYVLLKVSEKEKNDKRKHCPCS